MGGRFSIRKLFLDLLVIVCLVVAGWMGYQLFISRELNPVVGSIVLIVDIGVLIWNVAVLRSNYYRRMFPSFKLVFLPLLGIALILTFAGVQPLAGYKDSIIDQVATKIRSIEADVDEKETQAPNDYELRGTYTATVGYDPFSPNPTSSVKRTITFKGNTFTAQDAYLGKTICEYFIPGGLQSGQIIQFTNVATGEVSSERFRYTAEYDCFTIGEGYSAVTYYKR
jgi:hypothetical protein